MFLFLSAKLNKNSDSPKEKGKKSPSTGNSAVEGGGDLCHFEWHKLNGLQKMLTAIIPAGTYI